MLLSAYLLWFNDPNVILSQLTSEQGRGLISDALDDLIILQFYSDHEGEVFKAERTKDGNNIQVKTEVALDMAYSYHIYKKTGECIRKLYTVSNADGFSYDKNDSVFNRKKVFELVNAIYKGEGVSLPFDETFNSFLLDWLKDDCIKKDMTVCSLGYDSKGEFGLKRSYALDDLNQRTVQLLKSLMACAKSEVYEEDDSKTTKIQKVISAINQQLGVPAKTKVIFNASYNYLNAERASDRSTITRENALYEKFIHSMDTIVDSGTNTDVQYNRILADCKVIFDAKFNNSSNVKGDYTVGSYDRVIRDVNSSIYALADVADKSRINNFVKYMLGDDDFVKTMYNPVEIVENIETGESRQENPFISRVNNMPNSTRALVELALCLYNVNYVSMNSMLGLDFTEQDYIDTSKELFDKFSIQFFYGDALSDLKELVNNCFGIAEEENKLKEPKDFLIEFAYVTARSVMSKYFRTKLSDNLNKR